LGAALARRRVPLRRRIRGGLNEFRCCLTNKYRPAALEIPLPYRICQFPKPDGTPCGSPALLGKKFCYYHLRDHQRGQRIDTAVRRADVLGPQLPPMRSLRDVLAGLNEVVHALAEGRVSNQRAGRILFDLQQARVALSEQHSARK